MSDVREQQQRIEAVLTARTITGALRDIAAVEMKGLRDLFERNNEFSSELKKLFELVWRIAESAGVLENGLLADRSTLYVAYTTNRHFYGALNTNVMESFVAGTDSKDCCLIIGDTGKQYWLAQAKKRREISFLSFQDDVPTTQEIMNFLEKVETYAHVQVFYPGFVSVFRQETSMVDITFRPPDKKRSDKNAGVDSREEEPQYLLEPELSEMVTFFNVQVRYVLFERMLLETHLSRVAARVVKMDAADQNAKKLLERERRELRRAYASFSSRRMLETLVGYLQWHTQRV